MANNNDKVRLSPFTQITFSGMAALLIGIVAWQMDRTDKYLQNTLQVQKETNQVIERNTAAISELSRAVHSKL